MSENFRPEPTYTPPPPPRRGSDLTSRVSALEAAVLAVAASEFGDATGHQFHGNQYVVMGTTEAYAEIRNGGSERIHALGKEHAALEVSSPYSAKDILGRNPGATSYTNTLDAEHHVALGHEPRVGDVINGVTRISNAFHTPGTAIRYPVAAAAAELGDKHGHKFHGNQHKSEDEEYDVPAMSKKDQKDIAKLFGKLDFGDVDGHPFHGNQYGGGGDTRSGEEKAATLEVAERQNRWDHVDSGGHAPAKFYQPSGEKYKPQGRTDESSYDYTDSPANLADAGKERLQRDLDYAWADDGDDAKYVTVKFDYEESVPIQAVREAYQLAGRGRY